MHGTPSVPTPPSPPPARTAGSTVTPSICPADPAKLLRACTLSLVDLGTVDATDPVVRASQAQAVDATLARVLAARPPDSLVLVAGLSDTDTSSRLHVAIADGPGYDGGWLTSRAPAAPATCNWSTSRRRRSRRSGAGFRRSCSSDRRRSASARARPTRPAPSPGSPTPIGKPRVQHRVAGWFFGAVVVGGAAVAHRCDPAAAPRAPVGRAARTRAGRSPRIVRGVEALLVARRRDDPGRAADRHRAVVAGRLGPRRCSR